MSLILKPLSELGFIRVSGCTDPYVLVHKKYATLEIRVVKRDVRNAENLDSLLSPDTQIPS